jgi:hypothetical protein
MNKYPVSIGEIIKKECYVCSGLIEFTRRNGSVQASFIKILTAEYCVIRIVIYKFDIFTLVYSHY